MSIKDITLKTCTKFGVVLFQLDWWDLGHITKWQDEGGKCLEDMQV